MNLPILLAALAMLESGDARHPQGNDNAIGKAGELSRFQVTPALWRQYSSKNFNPRVKRHAEIVVTRRMSTMDFHFRTLTGRGPTAQDIYALWHRPAAFRKCGYRLDKMPRRVQDRCQRFANLVKELEKTQ